MPFVCAFTARSSMTWKGSFFRILVLVALFSTISTPCAIGDKSISPGEAVQVIETLEKKIEVAEWHIDALHGTLGNPSDLSTFVKTPDHAKGWVTFEPNSGRYRVE